jgi:hypothetical protein
MRRNGPEGLMAACGICLYGRRLVAVVVEEDGRAAPAIHSPADDDEQRWALLDTIDRHHGLDVELVIPDDLVRADSISRLALEMGHTIWAAPHRLVEALRRISGFAVTSPVRTAAMIARLAVVAGFRGHLRRVDRGFFDNRQLNLL